MKNLKIIFLILSASSILLTSCSSKKSKFDFRFGSNGLFYNYNNNQLYTGTVIDTAGVVIKFEVVNGEKNGAFKTYYLNGQIEKSGHILNNKNVGVWKYYFPNGQLESKGKFENNLAEGKWISYYSNGSKNCEGNYKNGKQEDEWFYYNEEGKLINILLFKDGKFIDYLFRTI